MINAEHDFTENFCSAVGYSNDFMMKDIIIDEVGRLIVENKPDVVRLLRQNGINATVNDSSKVISVYLVNEISKENEPIISGISLMIAKNRFEEQKYKSFIGKIKSEKNSKNKNAIGDIETQGATNIIKEALSKAYNKISPKQTAENQANLDERLKINQTRQKAKLNIKRILIITGIAGILGFMAYQLYKARKISQTL
jgi:hypothetical protein